ncbi:MAG: folylpolyglutamate synthase/dihydrofolate synthase family protein [Pseudomonadota bacterium]
MNYEKIIAYLDSLQPSSVRLELGPLTEACQLMGNPQDELTAIHISGTNGKGSTVAFLSSIFQQSGYKTGIFTSPHLVNIRERIQINRELISEDELVEVISLIRETIPDDRMLSYFEMLTLAAFLHFKKIKTDIAIFEAGLGGRLDATNVIHPKVSVITPISFDHMKHLGSSLREIATEKSGIIKRGVPTVVAYQPPDVMEVIRRVCDDVGSPLCLATPDEIKSPLGLLGEHQRQNAACAVEAADILSSAGFKISQVAEALAQTNWPGRLEVVSEKPRVILDSAHNVAGAEMLASYVRSSIPKKNAILLLGVLADKDIEGIVRQLVPQFREVIFTTAPSARAASPKDLAAAARSSSVDISIEEDVSSALTTTMKRMGDDDTLVVSGSITVVGEAKVFFSRMEKARSSEISANV